MNTTDNPDFQLLSNEEFSGLSMEEKVAYLARAIERITGGGVVAVVRSVGNDDGDRPSL